MGEIISAQLAAEALIDRGVEYIFTLSGGHITPIYASGKFSGKDIRYEA